MAERQAPGDGDLPVRAFLQALPDHVPIGIEIPQKSLAKQGIGHLERARRLLVRTQSLLAEAGRA